GGRAVVASLRRRPEALRRATEAGGAALAPARRLLREAMDAYRAGDATGARQRALLAYLDGFEPVEPLLAARDKPLMVRIEAAMAQLRSRIAANADPGVLHAPVDALDGLFAPAVAALAEGAAPSTAACWVIAVSGGSGELAGGLRVLTAGVVLVRVGIWMNGKGRGYVWQGYVREKLDQAMGRGSGLIVLALMLVV